MESREGDNIIVYGEYSFLRRAEPPKENDILIGEEDVKVLAQIV